MISVEAKFRYKFARIWQFLQLSIIFKDCLDLFYKSLLSVFGRVLYSLAKIGEDLYLEAQKDGLALRSTNSSRSAFMCYLVKSFLRFLFRMRVNITFNLILLRSSFLRWFRIPIISTTLTPFVSRVLLRVRMTTSVWFCHLSKRIKIQFLTL